MPGSLLALLLLLPALVRAEEPAQEPTDDSAPFAQVASPEELAAASALDALPTRWIARDVEARRWPDKNEVSVEFTEGDEVKVLVDDGELLRVKRGENYGWVPADALLDHPPGEDEAPAGEEAAPGEGSPPAEEPVPAGGEPSGEGEAPSGESSPASR